MRHHARRPKTPERSTRSPGGIERSLRQSSQAADVDLVQPSPRRERAAPRASSDSNHRDPRCRVDAARKPGARSRSLAISRRSHDVQERAGDRVAARSCEARRSPTAVSSWSNAGFASCSMSKRHGCGLRNRARRREARAHRAALARTKIKASRKNPIHRGQRFARRTEESVMGMSLRF